MKKILIIHDFKKGGAYESLMTLTNALEGEFEFYYCFKGPKKFSYKTQNKTHELYIRNWINYMGGNSIFHFLIKLPGILFLQILTIVRIMIIIKKHKIDIVHTNSRYYLEGALASKLLSVNHIWSVRELVKSHYYKQSSFNDFIFSRVINILSNKVLCNSITSLHQLIEIGVKEDKIIMIYNLIKSVEKKDKRDIKDIIKSNYSNQTIVAIIGWITPIKRTHEFTRLAGEFANRDVLFVILGEGTKREGEYYSKIRKEVEDLDNIIIAGYIKNVINYISSIDLLIHCSKDEAFGRVVAESQIQNVPAIVYQDSAVSELVINEITGYIVNDFVELKNRLNQFLDYVDSKEMPKSFINPNEYLEHLSYAKLVAEYRQLYLMKN